MWESSEYVILLTIKDKLIFFFKEIAKNSTLYEIPQIKIMFYVSKTFSHVFGNWGETFFNQCVKSQSTTYKGLNTVFENYRLHCWTTSSLISLQENIVFLLIASSEIQTL